MKAILLKKMLNPLHRLHRLASDIMVPDLIFNGNNRHADNDGLYICLSLTES
ncbi:hypothetical protein [Candidatus Nitrosocosmicus sp. R]